MNNRSEGKQARLRAATILPQPEKRSASGAREIKGHARIRTAMAGGGVFAEVFTKKAASAGQKRKRAYPKPCDFRYNRAGRLHAVLLYMQAAAHLSTEYGCIRVSSKDQNEARRWIAMKKFGTSAGGRDAEKCHGK